MLIQMLKVPLVLVLRIESYLQMSSLVKQRNFVDLKKIQKRMMDLKWKKYNCEEEDVNLLVEWKLGPYLQKKFLLLISFSYFASPLELLNQRKMQELNFDKCILIRFIKTIFNSNVSI